MTVYNIRELIEAKNRIVLFRQDIYHVAIGDPPPEDQRIARVVTNHGTPVHVCTTGILEWSLSCGLDIFVLVNQPKLHPMDAWWVELVPPDQIICKRPSSHLRTTRADRLLHLWRALIFKLQGRLSGINSTKDARDHLALDFCFLFGDQVIGKSFAH